MEGDLHITCSNRAHHRSQCPQLGLLDDSNGNSILHEERLAFQYQEECAVISTSVFCYDDHELDLESTRRLAEQQKDLKSGVLEKAFQHYRALGTDVRSHRISLRYITRPKLAGSCTCYSRSWHQCGNLLGLPNQSLGLGSESQRNFDGNHKLQCKHHVNYCTVARRICS